MSCVYLYIIESQKYNRQYIGVTYNLDARLDRHNAGRVLSTRKHTPYKLIYTEVFDNLKSARRREAFFKTSDGKRVVKNKLLSLV